MIGFFDSGVGGLSVLSQVQALVPNENLVYLADTKNFPYGPKSVEDVCTFSVAAAKRLMEFNPTAMVVACNTASTSALPRLRQEFPEVPIIGVVPAIKPATMLTKTGVVAVLATTATLASQSYRDLQQHYSRQATILTQACPGWVEMVEHGQVAGLTVQKEVEKIVKPLLEQQADVLVLGCTHYPFLRAVLESVVGLRVTIIDSGIAVAHQVEKVIKNSPRSGSDESGQVRYLCTGPAENFKQVASALLGQTITVTE